METAKSKLSTANLALEALERMEAAKEDLRRCVLELGDRTLAALGIQLDKLLGEINARLEGLVEG